MKVICRICGGLAKEEDAIKMTVAEFKGMEFNRAIKDADEPYGFYSYARGLSTSLGDMKNYTQICQRCYFGKKEPEKKTAIEIIEMSHEDRHTLFEFIKKINPYVEMIDDSVQILLGEIDGIIDKLVNDKIEKPETKILHNIWSQAAKNNLREFLCNMINESAADLPDFDMIKLLDIIDLSLINMTNK